MVTAPLFIMAQTWKHPKYPFAGEWINYGSARQWNITQH